MSKTIVHYSSEELTTLKELFSLPPSKVRREKIKLWGNSINRNYGSLYAKALSLGYAGPDVKKPKKPYKVVKQGVRTNGSEVSFTFTNIRINMDTRKIIFTIGK